MIQKDIKLKARNQNLFLKSQYNASALYYIYNASRSTCISHTAQLGKTVKWGHTKTVA